MFVSQMDPPLKNRVQRLEAYTGSQDVSTIRQQIDAARSRRQELVTRHTHLSADLGSLWTQQPQIESSIGQTANQTPEKWEALRQQLQDMRSELTQKRARCLQKLTA